MKAVISLPDRLFTAADALARKMGLSRSQLYATALGEYLAKHSAAKVTEQLNAVYSVQPSRLETPMRRSHQTIIAHNDW